MNWTNYDRLVNHLRTMAPSEFHYGYNHRAECGCVVVQVKRLGTEKLSGSPSVIRDFLCCGDLEAEYLYGYFRPDLDDSDAECIGTHKIPGFSIVVETSGAEGIRAALRRLAVVAARYQRPEQPVTPSIPTAEQEAAFLAICRQIAREPVGVGE